MRSVMHSIALLFPHAHGQLAARLDARQQGGKDGKGSKAAAFSGMPLNGANCT